MFSDRADDWSVVTDYLSKAVDDGRTLTAGIAIVAVINSVIIFALWRLASQQRASGATNDADRS